MTPKTHPAAGRRRFNPSLAALLISTLALFTALGGPAWAAGLVNGSQIKNGSITSAKIGRGQVRNANLASGAVTSSKVAPGSLTGADIAPGTFLPAGGTAANSTQLGGVPASGFLTAGGTAVNSEQLGGVPASGYLTTGGTAANANKLGGVAAGGFVQGTGNMLQHWLEVPAGDSDELIDVELGEVDAACVPASPAPLPEVTFTSEAAPVNFIEWGTTEGLSPDINEVAAMSLGSSYTEPDSTGGPQAIDFQVAQSGAEPSRVATIWTTDHYLSGTGCIFTAQALTTGD